METSYFVAEPQPACSPDPSGDHPRERCDRCGALTDIEELVTERLWEDDEPHHWGYMDIKVCPMCERPEPPPDDWDPREDRDC